MKSLYIVSAYDRGPSDVITPWLVETVRRLARRGVEVQVLVARAAEPGIGDSVFEGVLSGALLGPGGFAGCDAASQAHAIMRYANDPKLAAELASAVWAHLERELSWPVIIERPVPLHEGLRNR